MTVGLRVHTGFPRVTTAVIGMAASLPVSVVGDASNRLQCLPAGFRHYGARRKFAGPALTVRVRAGDNLLLHKALDLAQPGDVVVCDAGDEMRSAIMGALMARYATSRRISAVVISGAIRDVDELKELNIAVVARGSTPNGPFKSGPGEVGFPIACAGVIVSPGDLVIGDGDGVLVLPREGAAEIVGRAAEIAKLETQWASQIDDGTWPREWVNESLARMGLSA